MKKFNKKTIVLLAAASLLLLSSAVGSTRAALTYYSENYSAEVTVANIGVSLVENGDVVSYKNYLKDGNWDVKDGTLFAELLAEGDKVVLGQKYDEELKVYNSGAIDSYVRVILTKTWVDAEGNVDRTLDPAIIEIEENLGDGWLKDETASTKERAVYYYTNVLAVDSTTSDLTKSIRINPAIQTKMVEVVDGNNVTYVYEYDGYTFNVEAEVDAVQTHNAAEAIKSAWGVDVNVVADGSLSLQ